MVDTRDLKSLVGNNVPVRVRSPAPARRKRHIACDELFSTVRAYSCRSSSFSNCNRLRWASIWYLDAGSADIISFAATIFLTERLSPLAHFVAAHSKPKALHFGFGFFKGTRRFYIVTCTEQINPNRISTVGDGFGLFVYFDKFEKTHFRNGLPILCLGRLW